MINKISDKNNYLEMSQILRSIGHPIRLQMLMGLCGSECNVNKVWRQLGISQPLASQHLIKMRKAGLVASTRKGKQICYSVTDERVRSILTYMCDLFGVTEQKKTTKEK
ncbi:metalloregulator ArsR/SmtB family transcription factor [bacterium]|nr:metalloregulator ArsR/SmtB family transcription factor [bacterium]